MIDPEVSSRPRPASVSPPRRGASVSPRRRGLRPRGPKKYRMRRTYVPVTKSERFPVAGPRLRSPSASDAVFPPARSMAELDAEVSWSLPKSPKPRKFANLTEADKDASAILRVIYDGYSEREKLEEIA